MLTDVFKICFFERDLLLAEIETGLQLTPTAHSPDKVKTVFLSHCEEPYIWKSGDSDVVNNPTDLDNFPVIKSVLEKVKVKLGCGVNSVLVSRMHSGNAGLRLHDDNEESMDPHQPICVLSLGAKRTVEFCSKSQTDYRKTLHSITPDDTSLYVMKAGCQSHFLHRVRKNKSIKAPRYTLSFRCFIPKGERKTEQSTPSPVKNLIAKFEGPDEEFKTPASAGPYTSASSCSEQPNPTNSTPIPRDHSVPDLAKASLGFSPFACHDNIMFTSQESAPDTDKFCVIFGTSITQGVDGDLMSRGSRRVINRSVNGAKIGDIREEVRDFSIENPGVIRKVDKVILCIGTNDIKHFDCFKYDVSKRFRSPLTHLIKHIKFIFPNAQIIIKSVLPIQIKFKYIPKSVQDFNYLLIELCGKLGCIFFDCFAEFLDYYGVDCNNRLYRDWLHLNGEGLKVLCRALKYVIYHDIFNPFMKSSNCHYYY